MTTDTNLRQPQTRCAPWLRRSACLLAVACLAAATPLATPACIVSGETEKIGSMVTPVLEAYRPKGALCGWMTVQGGGHSRSGQEVLAMPLLDAAVRLRYPADADPRKGPADPGYRAHVAGAGHLRTPCRQGIRRLVFPRFTCYHGGSP